MLSRFWHGTTAILAGQRYLTRHPRLWGYAALPVFTQIVISLVFFWLGYLVAEGAVAWVSARMPVAGWAKPLWWAIKIGIYFSFFFLTVAFAWVVTSAVVFPLFEPLAQKVETALGAPAGGFKPLRFWNSLKDGLLLSLEMFMVNILCLLAHLVPGAGNVAAPILSFVVNSYFVGFALFEFSMSFRGFRRSEKKLWVNQHLGQVLGVGTIAFFFNLIPILGAVFLAPAVVGAVLRYRERDDTMR